MKQVVILLACFLFAASSVFSSEGLTLTSSFATPLRNVPKLNKDVSAFTLISPNSCRRSEFHASRRIFAHGDTVSVIYSDVVDPAATDFQRMYQAYSLDAGASWTSQEIGTGQLRRTYPCQDNVFDINAADPIGSAPYATWMELLGDNTGGCRFTYDEIVPFQIFTPVQVTDSAMYEPTIMVWGQGDTIWGTGQDLLYTGDLLQWFSTDHGATWNVSTWIPIGTHYDFTNAFIENGSNGYGMAIMGVSEAVDKHYLPVYYETTDYGQTWSGGDPFMIVVDTDTTPPDTLGMTWMAGYSAVVDHNTNMPYIVAKLDPGRDGSSYYLGEIWFNKPNGGTFGSWTFDASNPVAIVDSGPAWDYMANYVQIGFYYTTVATDTFPMLYVCYSALSSDTTVDVFLATSTDHGNTWNHFQVTDDPTVTRWLSQVSPYVDHNGNIHMIFCNNFQGGDTDYLPLYHVSVNVVTDLGLPAAGPYPVAVEENPNVEIPREYRVVANTKGNVCTFEVSIPESGMTNLSIFDATGRKVAELVNGRLDMGTHTFSLNASQVTTGSYFYRLTSNGFVANGKVLIGR